MNKKSSYQPGIARLTIYLKNKSKESDFKTTQSFKNVKNSEINPILLQFEKNDISKIEYNQKPYGYNIEESTSTIFLR